MALPAMPRPLASLQAGGMPGEGETMDSDIKVALAARELAYGVFWRLFSEGPDNELLKTLQRKEFEEALQLVMGEGALDVDRLRSRVEEIAQKMELDADGFLDELKSEYMRDFVGPGKLVAYPWESMNVEGDKSLFQGCTIEVRREFVRHGLQPVHYGSVADDHLALELHFLFKLTEECIHLVDEGDCAQARTVLEDERSFSSRHLLNWVPAYVHDFQEKRCGSFYAFWLGLLLELLKADHCLLGELIDEMA